MDERMTLEEYERLYADAVASLKRAIMGVANPRLRPLEHGCSLSMGRSSMMRWSSDWHGEKKPHGTLWTNDRDLVGKSHLPDHAARSVFGLMPYPAVAVLTFSVRSRMSIVKASRSLPLNVTRRMPGSATSSEVSIIAPAGMVTKL